MAASAILYWLSPFSTGKRVSHVSRAFEKSACCDRFRRRLASVGHNERGVQLVRAGDCFTALHDSVCRHSRIWSVLLRIHNAFKSGACRGTVPGYKKVDCAQADLARNLVVYGNTAGTGSPILPGLLTSNVSITPNDLACAGTPQGVPTRITVTISGFKHQSLFNIGGSAEQCEPFQWTSTLSRVSLCAIC